jgi:hypothetical protein
MRGFAWSSSCIALATLIALPGSAQEGPVEARGVIFDCATTSTGASEDLVTALAVAVARKWNLGAVSSESLASTVTVRVCFSREGRPERLILIAAEGPSVEAVDMLFESARRAVNRAYADGGLPLPQAQYDTWRVLDLVFDANGMRLR